MRYLNLTPSSYWLRKTGLEQDEGIIAWLLISAARLQGQFGRELWMTMVMCMRTTGRCRDMILETRETASPSMGGERRRGFIPICKPSRCGAYSWMACSYKCGKQPGNNPGSSFRTRDLCSGFERKRPSGWKYRADDR